LAGKIFFPENFKKKMAKNFAKKAIFANSEKASATPVKMANVAKYTCRDAPHLGSFYQFRATFFEAKTEIYVCQ